MTKPQTITQAERDSIMARETALKAYCVEQGFTNNGWSSYRPEQVAHLNPPTNEERSSVELFDFVNNPPDRYLLYVSEAKADAHTWMGEHLDHCYFGREWRDNFGGKRVPVTIKAINGLTYAGTYFKSSGDFARVKRVKSL